MLPKKQILELDAALACKSDLSILHQIVFLCGICYELMYIL
jgi:hypothetical protein